VVPTSLSQSAAPPAQAPALPAAAPQDAPSLALAERALVLADAGPRFPPSVVLSAGDAKRLIVDQGLLGRVSERSGVGSARVDG